MRKELIAQIGTRIGEGMMAIGPIVADVCLSAGFRVTDAYGTRGGARSRNLPEPDRV